MNRNFRFQLHFCAKPYARSPLASTSNRPGRGCGTNPAPFAVLLTALACYLGRRWHSSPRDDDSSTVSSQSLLVRYPFVSGAAWSMTRVKNSRNDPPRRFGRLIGVWIAARIRSKRGTPLCETNVLYEFLHPVLKALRLPQAGMHAFRHGCNRSWELSRMNPAVLRQQMGYSSAVMTARYIGEIPLEQVRASCNGSIEASQASDVGLIRGVACVYPHGSVPRRKGIRYIEKVSRFVRIKGSGGPPMEF